MALLMTACASGFPGEAPPTGPFVSGEDLLRRMRWLAQSGRMNDAETILQVTGGRFRPRTPGGLSWRFYIEDSSIPDIAWHDLFYTIPSVERTGPGRLRYQLYVSIQRFPFCITPNMTWRVLGRHMEMGPPPIGLRGSLLKHNNVTSLVYEFRPSASGMSGLEVSFNYNRCADGVGVSQPAADDEDGMNLSTGSPQTSPRP